MAAMSDIAERAGDVLVVAEQAVEEQVGRDAAAEVKENSA
jgi:hypothetical protein